MADTEQVPRPRRTRRTPDTSGTPESGGTPASSSAKRTSADAKLYESVKGVYEAIGMLGLGLGLPRGDERLLNVANVLMEPKRAQQMDPVTGDIQTAVVDPRTGAEAIADTWMTVADRNPKVKAALKRFTEGGAVAELAMMHLPLVLPFLPGVPGLGALLGKVRPTQPPPPTDVPPTVVFPDATGAPSI